MSALAYADNIALLASTTPAMRLMLGICDDFAQEYSIVFNAKKSKCLRVKHSSTTKVASDGKPQVVIGVSVIEFVDSWPHLEHITHRESLLPCLALIRHLDCGIRMVSLHWEQGSKNKGKQCNCW